MLAELTSYATDRCVFNNISVYLRINWSFFVYFLTSSITSFIAEDKLLRIFMFLAWSSVNMQSLNVNISSAFLFKQE